MSEICISSSCADDTRSPVRATYVNLYKWPESDAEFVKSASLHGGARLDDRVVDSISCRQMYLRSYTFSRKETLLEKTMKCLTEVGENVAVAGREMKGKSCRNMKIKGLMLTKEVKELSAAALRAILRRASVLHNLYRCGGT